jgi:hypothetical protein
VKSATDPLKVGAASRPDDVLVSATFKEAAARRARTRGEDNIVNQKVAGVS